MMPPLDGTRTILDRTKAWITSDSTMTACGRIIGIGSGGAAAAGVLIAKPILWWPVTAGWLIAAALQRPAGCNCEQTGDTFDPAWFVDATREYMTSRGRDRALLLELAGHFGVDNKTVREWAQAAGVDVKRSIRVKGVGHNTGIYLSALPDHSPSATVAGVDSGHSVNVNVNGTPISSIYPDPDRGPNAFKVIHS